MNLRYFLTKYGQGDIWVEDESTKHDVIFARGTPGLKFAWETRYQQIDSWAERLRENNFEQIKRINISRRIRRINCIY